MEFYRRQDFSAAEQQVSPAPSRRSYKPKQSTQQWLTIGQSLLETGQHLPAATAFTKAITADRNDGAAYLGRAEALENIDPAASASDLEAAARLGIRPLEDFVVDLDAAHGRVTLYVDITDMMAYMAVNNSFSGIQRVVGNFIRHARQMSDAVLLIPVIPDFGAKILYGTDVDTVLDLINAVELHHSSREHFDRLLHRIRSSLRFIEPAKGDVFLMAGAFWISHNYDLLRALREKHVVVTIFIHDLIQLNNPEHVEALATDVFLRSLIDVLEVSNFLLTNSKYVEKDVRRFLTNELLLSKPVKAVPLAADVSFPQPDYRQEQNLKLSFPKGYVLCVCTIEIRKNHQYLADIWERLIASGRDVPDLVLVGKWGWEIDSFRSYLARTENLNNRIHIMSGVSDSLLADLYRGCLFTVYPSFAEGWGLPVGESLVSGKPCIASGTTSIPEVGRDLVRYIDPLDLQTGLKEIARLLDDREDLARWQTKVQTDFCAKTWEQFSAELVQVTAALARTVGSEPATSYARIKPGELAVIGGDAVTSAWYTRKSLRTARMARAEGWHNAELSGSWIKNRFASLAFTALDCDPGEEVCVVVEIRGASSSDISRCTLMAGGDSSASYELSAGWRVCHCLGKVAPDGMLTLSFEIEGNLHPIDHRDAFAMVSRVGFYRAGAGPEKLAILEAMLIPD